MTRFNCFAAALLAGSAMVALPALAQASASPDAQPPILKDGGKSGSADSNGAAGGKTSSSAGAKDQKATEASPDQKQPPVKARPPARLRPTR
ncbi:hypothetical protein [Mesorhizobium sp. IMUNJ 23232]|uniref:hypothetical protein n=1 Tax=Mesorhizobium sp. IMUNJ 23232 TaxID=3376064 RepID=UPI00379A146E